MAWNKLAEICHQLLKKGNKVYIKGSLRTRSWEDENGTKRYRTEVKADEMILLTGKASADGSEASDEDLGGLDDLTLDDLEPDSKKVEESDKKASKKDSKQKKSSDKKSDSSSKEDESEEDDLPF